jgi:hypothetical protein
MADVALTGAMTGAVVGISGMSFGWWNAEKERQGRVALA